MVRGRMGTKSLNNVKFNKFKSKREEYCMVQLWENKAVKSIKFVFHILFPMMLYCCLNIAVYCQRKCLKELKETC